MHIILLFSNLFFLLCWYWRNYEKLINKEKSQYVVYVLSVVFP